MFFLYILVLFKDNFYATKVAYMSGWYKKYSCFILDALSTGLGRHTRHIGAYSTQLGEIPSPVHIKAICVCIYLL